jgi:hypothetical protein
MTDDKFIKTAIIDIVSITTIWGLINCSDNISCNFFMNSKYFNLEFNYSKKYLIIVGLGVSGYVLGKYY